MSAENAQKDAIARENSIEEASESPAITEKYGTENDKRDMSRLGKLQELRRNFEFLSIWGYAMVLGGTWEFALIGAIFSLPNGGPGGAIWMFLIVAVFFYLVMLSLAEMASIAPTCGGQYHWVSELAPRKYQKPLSFFVGWLVVLAWQSGMIGTAFSAALQIEALIVLAKPDYIIKGWHEALLTIATTIFCIFFNTYLIRRLPLLEGFAMVLHILGFFTFIIVLWVMGPRSDAKTVFTSFEDNNGWGSVSLATLVGLLSPISSLMSGDSACHLSEELRDASRTLPLSMIATASVNYLLGFIMTVSLMFTVGDVGEAVSSPTGQPYVHVILNATQSKGATIVLTTIIALLITFATINVVTTSSRQIFAFARDKGLPFADFLSYVRPGWDIPLNAVVVTFVFTVLLSLIIIGSTIAFQVIISISAVGLISSYLIAIVSMIARRLSGEPLPPSRFSLGRAGMYINIAAAAFLIVAWIILFFPSAPNPTPQSMNWVCLIFGCTLIFSGTYYLVKGRYKYDGPVELIKTQ